MDRVVALGKANAVVIFSKSSCCMCHAIKRFFRELGVNIAVHELDEDQRGKEMEKALARLIGRGQPIPAVFVGGRLVGPMDKVMAHHLNGTLVPQLREAGALWL